MGLLWYLSGEVFYLHISFCSIFLSSVTVTWFLWELPHLTRLNVLDRGKLSLMASSPIDHCAPNFCASCWVLELEATMLICHTASLGNFMGFNSEV